MALLENFEMTEVIAEGIAKVLEERLPTAIEEINAEKTDLVLPPPAQILPYIGTEASTLAGMPIFGVADMPARFEDDLVTSLTAAYEFYVHVVVQDSDNGTLVKMLRRYLRAIAVSLQADRSAPLTEGKPSVLSREGLGIWALMFETIQPGPMLGDRDPNAPDAAPTSWLSWTGLVVSCKREEL